MAKCKFCDVEGLQGRDLFKHKWDKHREEMLAQTQRARPIGKSRQAEKAKARGEELYREMFRQKEAGQGDSTKGSFGYSPKEVEKLLQEFKDLLKGILEASETADMAFKMMKEREVFDLRRRNERLSQVIRVLLEE